MKRILLASVVVLTLGSSALAQSTIVPALIPNLGTTIMIAPEQRAKIVKFIIQQKVKPVELGKQIAIGEKLAFDVELMVFPSDWGPALSRYGFVYSQDGIAVVEPSSHRVVQIIE